MKYSLFLQAVTATYNGSLVISTLYVILVVSLQ